MPTITFNGANGTMCTVACENDASVRFSTDDNAITVVITSIRHAEAEAEGKVGADAEESECDPKECRSCDQDAEEPECDLKECCLCDKEESESQEVDEPSGDFEQVLFELTEQLGRCVAVLARRMRK